MMIYLSDGSGEMVFSMDDAYRVIEEKLGSGIIDYIRNEENEIAEEREYECYEKVNHAQNLVYDLMEILKPLTKKEGKTGKLFEKLNKSLESIECDLRDARDLLEIQQSLLIERAVSLPTERLSL